MKKSVVRLFAAMLVLMIAMGSVCAFADYEEWTCPKCNKTGNTKDYCPNCGTARPVDGQAVSEWLEQIPGETERVKVCLDSVDASDYIVNRKNPDKWLPEHAADGDESTCWQVRFKSGSQGKVWLQLNTGKEQTVEEIWFKNGFWAYNDKGIDQYYINARAKSIRVMFLYSGESKYRDEISLELKDEVFTDWQRFSLGHHEQVTAVRVVVYSKYQGEEKSCANDLCMSEVMLVKYAPASSAKPARDPGEATVYESRPEISGAKLLMQLATRTGPGTEYSGSHSFFQNNWQKQTVRVLGKSWDDRNGIWWVLVDFRNGTKASYRVWTGLKRVDVDISKLKEIYAIGQGTVDATSDTYFGPGGNYAQAKVTINGWKDVLAFGRENGYVEVEFEQGGTMYRVWVPEGKTSIEWGTDYSGNR